MTGMQTAKQSTRLLAGIVALLGGLATALYPATEKYTTLGQSTLAAGYTSGGTSISVASASSFPTAGNFRVRIENEIFKVSAVSGTTLTVVGAQEGTSAANHGFGVAITEVLTAAALDAIRADITSIGLLSALPSTTGQTAGNQYFATDGLYHYVFNGSAWVEYLGPNKNIRTVGASFGSFESGATALSGSKTFCVETHFAGTIKQATLIADVSGSVTVDVLTVAHSSWTGRASVSSITAAAIPALSSASKYSDTTLTGWTTAVAADTDFCFALTSPTTVAGVAITIKIEAD